MWRVLLGKSVLSSENWCARPILNIAPDVLSGDGRLGGIFGIFGGCFAELLADGKEPARQTFAIGVVVADQQSGFALARYKSGNVHGVGRCLK